MLTSASGVLFKHFKW